MPKPTSTGFFNCKDCSLCRYFSTAIKSVSLPVVAEELTAYRKPELNESSFLILSSEVSGVIRKIKSSPILWMIAPYSVSNSNSGKSGKISAEPIKLSAADCGGWFEHAGWRVHIPDDATVQWPVLPHNQYVKDGHAEPKEGRLVVTLPFTKEKLVQQITVEVP